MYQFYDYFDLDKSRQPYSSAGEELEDYLHLLDMMLENYLESKGMGSQQKLFSRGLVITESEMNGYFEMPPFFRERDIWDPVLVASADAAFSYIEERSALMAEQKKFRTDLPSANFESNRLALSVLKESFGLSRTELVAVLLALSVEIDRRYERIFGFLQDDISKGTPSFGLLYALMGRITPRESAEEMMPLPMDDRMYTYFFIRKEGQEGLHAPLVLQPLMKKILIGIPDSGANHSAVFRLFEENADIPLFFEESYRDLSFILSKENDEIPDTDEMLFAKKAVYIGNEDRDSVLHLIYHYCLENHEKLYILDVQKLYGLTKENRHFVLAELFLRLKLHNGRLALFFTPDNDSAASQPDEQEISSRSLLKEICHASTPKTVCIFGEKEEPGDLASNLIPFLRVPDAPVLLRTKMWEYFLNAESDLKIAKDVVVPDLADCYEIPYGKVRKVLGHANASARLKQDLVIDRSMILDSLRQMNQVDFSGLATFVNPSYTWDDITITPSQKAVMKTACDRYRLRNRIGEGWGLKKRNAYGNGVSILLYGPPGTGKTMAAQVIANELSLPLYRVDISQISSKYIGETEKNLATIFNAAAKANVILFFDEADALFSKRTSVGDSHDKYANSETAYLLQKIEEYDGMSILSTNYYNNFDDAFVRRITYSVHMEQPDKETRYTLWTSILPKSAKISKDIDFRFLADKFDLSGSNIKAILFNAAYMAGAENKAISMKQIVRAMEYEFNKLGKLVNESDFDKYDIYLQSGGKKKSDSDKKTKSK